MRFTGAPFVLAAAVAAVGLIGSATMTASATVSAAKAAELTDLDSCSLLAPDFVKSTLGVTVAAGTSQHFPQTSGSHDAVACNFTQPGIVVQGGEPSVLVSVSTQRLRPRDIKPSHTYVRKSYPTEIRKIGSIATLRSATHATTNGKPTLTGGGLAAVVGTTLLDMSVNPILTNGGTTITAPTDAQITAIGKEVARAISAATKNSK